MIARLRRRLGAREEGFTLIELLTVCIIIGLLAAIAIPLFLSQRRRGVQASMQSDLRNLATRLEASYADTQRYPAVGGFTGTADPVILQAGDVVHVSQGNSFTYALDPSGQAYCVVASNPGAAQPIVYVSSLGGLQDTGTTSCPASY